mmetsp:Transcript_8807/g.11840  ORF Transcript_8807/g.11840 Transcript_8807/m.11840 type:complete len:175 (-) Transcript_8807:226-750(-)
MEECKATVSEQIASLEKGLGRSRITSSFYSKAKEHHGCLPVSLFRSFLQFHLNEEVSDDQMDHWNYIFDFEDCVQTSHFNMIYTMYNLKPDTRANALENFKAIDVDGNGTLEKEELNDWLRLAFRSGYLKVRCGDNGPEECFEKLQNQVFRTHGSKFFTSENFHPNRFCVDIDG